MTKFTSKKVKADEKLHPKFESIKKRNKTEDKFYMGKPVLKKVVKDEAVIQHIPIKELKKSSDVIEDNFKSLWSSYKPRKNTLVRAGQDWQSHLMSENRIYKPIPFSIRKSLKEYASCLYEEEVNNYLAVEGKKQSRSNNEMLKQAVLSHGTLKDKVSALALQCMQSPVHTLHNFNALISFIGPKGKTQYAETIDHVQNLVDLTYLAHHYATKEFDCHDFSILAPLIRSNREQVDKLLILWYYEDQFRYSYQNIINNLEMLTQNTVHNIKVLGLKALLSLVSKHPQEATEDILSKLVNKFGDNSKKIASYAVMGLTALLRRNPSLKITVVSLSEELLYRHNIQKKAQYFALCFLKDILFKRGDEKLAEKMIKLYMAFFKSCSQSGEVETRFMSALLRGLNRAFPYVSPEGGGVTFVEEQLDALYKLCHVVHFNIATQALQIVYQIQTKNSEELSNRFFQVLYNLIMDPSFANSTSNGAFLNLIFKSMSRDTILARLRAYTRRLLQIAKYQSPQNACGILYLLSEVVKDNVKLDNLKTLLTPSHFEQHGTNEEDLEDDDEYYVDYDADEEGNPLPLKGKKKKVQLESKGDLGVVAAPSWLHRNNLQEFSDDHVTLKTKIYDPSARNPLYSGAQLSPLWELVQLGNHFHPTVSLFASNILKGVYVKYSGDPLEDFTLMKFLDRFIHRNPKKITTSQTMAVFGAKRKTRKGIKKINVESDDFRNLKESKIPADDYFFYKYAKNYSKKAKLEGKDDKDLGNEGDEDEEEDTESIGDEEFEQILKKKNFGHFVNPDVDDFSGIDFGKSAGQVLEDDKKLLASDEEEEEEEDFDDGGGGDVSGSGDDEDDFEDVGGEFDETMEGEEDDFNEFDDDEEFSVEEKRLKRKNRDLDFDDGDDDNFGGLLADAGDFADILEGNAGQDTGGSDALWNKDKSSIKQMAWEKRRYGTQVFNGGQRGGKSDSQFKGGKKKSFQSKQKSKRKY